MKQGTVIRILPAEDDDGPTVETTLGTFNMVCFEFDPKPNDIFELDDTRALTVCHLVK